MGDGKHRQIDAVLIQSADLGAHPQTVDVIIMRAGNQLRKPGRPAGKLEKGNIPGPRSLDVVRRLGIQIVQRRVLSRIPGHNHVAQACNRLPHLVGKLAVIKSHVDIRDNISRRFREFAQIDDLALAMGRQGKDGQRAQRNSAKITSKNCGIFGN